MSVSLVFKVPIPGEFLAGQGDGEMLDVSSFTSEPKVFRCVARNGSEFLLSRKTWKRLGEPAHIRVSVEKA